MKKILVVDNNKSFINEFRTNLCRGFEIIEASNGWEGLELANEYIPDLIVSKLRLPQLSGIEFSVQIKKLPLLNKIPFMLITQEEENQRINLFNHRQIDYLISKEFSFSDFMNYIRKILS